MIACVYGYAPFAMCGADFRIYSTGNTVFLTPMLRRGWIIGIDMGG